MEYTKKTFTTERVTITIHKPILNKAEQAKREQDMVQALERFGKAIEKEKTKCRE